MTSSARTWGELRSRAASPPCDFIAIYALMCELRGDERRAAAQYVLDHEVTFEPEVTERLEELRGAEAVLERWGQRIAWVTAWEIVVRQQTALPEVFIADHALKEHWIEGAVEDEAIDRRRVEILSLRTAGETGYAEVGTIWRDLAVALLQTDAPKSARDLHEVLAEKVRSLETVRRLGVEGAEALGRVVQRYEDAVTQGRERGTLRGGAYLMRWAAGEALRLRETIARADTALAERNQRTEHRAATKRAQIEEALTTYILRILAG